MSKVTVPSGTLVHFTFTNSQGKLESVEAQLESDYEIQLSTHFEKFLDLKPPTWVKALTQFVSNNTSIQIGSFQYKQLGYQIWTDTDPIKLNLSVTIYPKGDRTPLQVAQDAKAMMRIPLPTNAGATGLIPPGPDIGYMIGLKNGEGGTSKGSCTVRIGRFQITEGLVESVVPTVSKTQIRYNGGYYPAYFKLQISVSGNMTATTEDIEKWWSA